MFITRRSIPTRFHKDNFNGVAPLPVMSIPARFIFTGTETFTILIYRSATIEAGGEGGGEEGGVL